MPKRSSKDVNQLAHGILEAVLGRQEEAPKKPRKNAAAVALGRRGGLKGGKARAKSLTPQQRAEIAKKAAAARWGKG
jgi:hypothetical protein